MCPRRVGPAGAAMTMFICLLVPYRLLAKGAAVEFEIWSAHTRQLCSASSDGPVDDIRRWTDPAHASIRRVSQADRAAITAI